MNRFRVNLLLSDHRSRTSLRFSSKQILGSYMSTNNTGKDPLAKDSNFLPDGWLDRGTTLRRYQPRRGLVTGDSCCTC